jgi:hypothetical protein
VVLRHILMLPAYTLRPYMQVLGLLMDNTLAQSCITRPKVCLSIIHLFSGKDGSGQGQITDKEKKKQAIQMYCCNNNYMLTKCCWQSLGTTIDCNRRFKRC